MYLVLVLSISLILVSNETLLVAHVVRKAGAKIIYGAMWDEYDEGTAFMPIVSKKRELPREETFLALDADGYDLPTDW